MPSFDFVTDEQFADLSDHPLPPDVASQIYTWANDPSQAVLLRNHDLYNIGLYGGKYADAILPIYRHRRRPCIFATVAGIVVGATKKDRQWDYLLDDGSQVIDFSVQFKSISLFIPISAENFPTSKEKMDGLSLKPSIEVGDIVRVTGRIWRRQYTSEWGGSATHRIGLDVSSLDTLNHDPTAESRHNLEAHRLAQREYSEPFELSSQQSALVRLRVPMPIQSTNDVEAWKLCTSLEDRLVTKFGKDLRRLGTSRPRRQEGNAASARKTFHREISCVDHTCIDERSVELTFQAFMEDVQDASISSSSKLVAAEPSTPQRASHFHGVQDGSPISPIGRSATAPLSPVTSLPCPASSNRSLRSPSRLNDSQCTQQMFRLQTQKFLMDFCSQSSNHCNYAGESAKIANVKGLDNSPPAFTFAFLTRIKVLNELADRVVTALLIARAKRKRNANATGRDLGASAPSTTSHEPKTHKIRRLFEWCVLQLVQDGFLVLAPDSTQDPSHRPYWPFNGAQTPTAVTSRSMRGLCACQECSRSWPASNAVTTALARQNPSSAFARLGTSRVVLGTSCQGTSVAKTWSYVDRKLLAQLNFDEASGRNNSKPLKLTNASWPVTNRKIFKHKRDVVWQNVSIPFSEHEDDDRTVTTCASKNLPLEHRPSVPTVTSQTNSEAYQVLTPSFLVPFLVPILQRSFQLGGRARQSKFDQQKIACSPAEDPHRGVSVEIDIDVDSALYQLKRSDDRWRYVSVDCVREALDLLRFPCVSDAS